MGSGKYIGKRYKVIVRHPGTGSFLAYIISTKEDMHWATDTCEEVDTEVARMKDIIKLCRQ